MVSLLLVARIQFMMKSISENSDDNTDCEAAATTYKSRRLLIQFCVRLANRKFGRTFIGLDLASPASAPIYKCINIFGFPSSRYHSDNREGNDNIDQQLSDCGSREPHTG